MGALLGQSKEAGHDLGESKWWEKALEYGDDVIKVADSLIGGGGGGGSCAAKRQQWEQKIRQYLTQEDMNRLTAGLRPRIQPTPQSMAYFEAGEDDCKHRNLSAKHKRFRNEMKTLIRQRMQEQSGSDSNLPANMMISDGGIPSWLKYTLIAGGVVGVGTAAYAGYQSLTSKK